MKTLLSSAALALALTAPVAHAGPTTFTYDAYTVNHGQVVKIKPPAAPVFLVNAGQIDLRGSGPDVGKTLLTWCIDVLHVLRHSDTYDLVAPPGPAPLDAAQIGEIGALMDYGNDHVASPNVSAGAQMAIWDVEYNPLGFHFGSTLAVQAEAAALLATALPLDSSWLALVDAPGLPNQALATVPVAEPPMWSLWLSVFGLLAGWAVLNHGKRGSFVGL